MPASAFYKFLIRTYLYRVGSDATPELSCLVVAVLKSLPHWYNSGGGGVFHNQCQLWKIWVFWATVCDVVYCPFWCCQRRWFGIGREDLSGLVADRGSKYFLFIYVDSQIAEITLAFPSCPVSTTGKTLTSLFSKLCFWLIDSVRKHSSWVSKRISPKQWYHIHIQCLQNAW